MSKNIVAPSVKAKEIIRKLYIREPSEIHIKDIAMKQGAFVRERELEGSEARLVRRGNLGIICINSRIPEEGRKRFAVAHELGHFELHNHTQLILCTEEDMFFWNESKKQEIEANEFAASILMPEEIFLRYIKLVPPNMDTIKQVSKEFRTTLTATALRYVKLSNEPCAVVISNGGIVRWYKKSDSFDFHVNVGERLNPYTYAFNFYDGVGLPGQPEKTPATAWLAGNLDEEAEIFEHSVALPSYNVVLSLLWIDADIHPESAGYDEDGPEFDLTNPLTPDGKRWRW